MKKLKIYIAGKVSPNSVFGRYDWRDNFCQKLSESSGFEFINLDPNKSQEGFDLDENDSQLIFGRDCFMIKTADLVIVNLTDDISVGGSQEMLIAKYYRKPLIGIAAKGGKFFRTQKEILGKTYDNWLHPFVKITCDYVVEDIKEAGKIVEHHFDQPEKAVKGLEILDETIQYYQDHFHDSDQFLRDL